MKEITERQLERQKAKEKKAKEKALESQRNRIYEQMIAQEKLNKKKRKIAPKDAYISLQNINKIYPNKVQAVFNFNLDIKKNEFIVFVGPSGCGKSTTLRMIAGLEDITAGDLYIDGVYANDIEPKDRDIAMVFQSYALYPHMTVAGNMAFGLKIRKVPTLVMDKNNEPLKSINRGLIRDYKKELKDLMDVYEKAQNDNDAENIAKYEQYIAETKDKIAYLEQTPVPVYKNKHLPKAEIKARVDEAAKILQISEYLSRKPKALSGGQCQRVALGRAIVRNAKVFLMDEPLSNLDAKLRVQMRSEIVRLHNRLKATTIYVTHDQTEAMTMASRIVVMNKGYVQQIGTPIEIYNHPANLFVATFIGSPAMNLYEVTYNEDELVFEDGTTIPVTSAYKKVIEDFFKQESAQLKQELEDIDEEFVERKQVLDALANIDPNKDQETQEKMKNDLQKRLSEIEDSHERRKEILRILQGYEEMKETKTLVFGIRPEDIYKATVTTQKEKNMSKPISLVVQVAELMGHEYYLHTTFANRDLVSKIDTKKIINQGDKVRLVFDLSRAHLFDKWTQKLIK